MSLDNLKQAVTELTKALNEVPTPKQTREESTVAAPDPLLQDVQQVGASVEDAPAPPIFGLDTSLKDINEAIRRAEFRSLQNDNLLKETALRREVVQRLNDNDASASIANAATIKKMTEKNEKLRSQVVQFLES
ncbi:hypothetical protein MMC07_008922 [Pseudocyphellaria aurata]|nr:hypothetical protein [Pseudocyphellaria aurata]